MEEKLREYVRECFADAPRTVRAAEVCEEICSNVVDRYRDLMKSGARPEEAYDIACRSVGNVQDILNELKEEPYMTELAEKNAKKRGVWVGWGVAMYLVGVGILILLASFNQGGAGAACLLACCGVATAMCIYGCTAYPKTLSYGVRGMSEEEAEDYQRWRAERMGFEERNRRYNGVLWPLVAAVYFVVSFATGAWGITWIIFLIGGALSRLIEVLQK